MVITAPWRFVRPSGSAILPVVSMPCDSNVSTRLTLRGLILINGKKRWFDLLPTYATSTTVFLNGSNCTVKFQFCEYGIFRLADVGVTAKPGTPRLLRKTKPLESVPRIESRVPEAPCNGGLPVKRIGCVGSSVP